MELDFVNTDRYENIMKYGIEVNTDKKKKADINASEHGNEAYNDKCR